MRKGGAGIMPSHSPMSKSAAVRTIQDGFNISNVSNVDLILRRKSPPSGDSIRQNSAGAVSSERRGPDFPAVVRQTSLEHIVHRRHSPSPSRTQRGQENLMVRLATVKEDVKRIGRSMNGHTRSRSPNRSPSPLQSPRARSPKRMSSCPCPRKMAALPVFKPGLVCKSSSCSWGESHAFDGVEVEAYEELNQSATILCTSNIDLDKTAPFKGRSYSGWSSDDGRSTATGGSSPIRLFSASSFHSECPTPPFVANGLVGDGPVDIKRCVEMYERRMKALVKAEQKKSLSKIGR